MPTPPPQSTGFVSLGDYLNANQDGANNLADGQAQSAAAAGNAAMAADNTLGQQAAAGYKQQYYVNENVAQHPNAGAAYNNDPNYKAGVYDPTQAAGYGDAVAKTDAANTQLDGLTNQDALTSQLARRAGPGYTAGDAMLDGAMLQNQGAQDKFNAVKGQFGGLSDYLDKAANSGSDFGAANGFGKPGTYHPPATTGGTRVAPGGDGTDPTIGGVKMNPRGDDNPRPTIVSSGGSGDAFSNMDETNNKAKSQSGTDDPNIVDSKHGGGF